MRLLVFLLFFMAPVIVFGQFQIRGSVVDQADKKPIPGASVFLSNASVGSATLVDGTFILSNVRGGQYELVVSMLGYETYREQVLVTENMNLPVIAINSKTNTLKEVVIHPDAEWENNYAMFKEEFLGTSVYAQDCKILNPEILDLTFEKIGRVLTASSTDYLIIENRALGYKIKYQLNAFEKDYKKATLYFAGTASFENMKGKKSLERRWLQNRLAVYKGSSMHFLRAVIEGKTTAEGFKALRLIRKPNPAFNGLNNPYIAELISTPLPVSSYEKPTNKDGLYALLFDDCLYVMFNGGTPVVENDNNPNGIGWSTTTLTLNQSYAVFDNNGILIDPSAITFEGSWGRSRMASLLPVDYEPGK